MYMKKVIYFVFVMWLQLTGNLAQPKIIFKKTKKTLDSYSVLYLY